MPNLRTRAYAETKDSIKQNSISKFQFWQVFAEALRHKDESFLDELIEYNLNNKCYEDLEAKNHVLKSMSLVDMDYALPWLKKAFIFTASILDAVVQKNTENNSDLAKLQKEVVSKIIESELKDIYFLLEANNVMTYHTYKHDINIEQLKEIKEQLFLYKPDALLAFVIATKSENIELRKELIDKALNGGASFKRVIKDYNIGEVNTLNNLADYLLNHPRHPVEPKIFLELVLSCPTLKYDSSINEHVNDLALIKVKQGLIKKCADKGATIGNQFTIYHDPGHHAFVKLDCSNCDKGQAASVYVGLHPSYLSENAQTPVDQEMGSKDQIKYLASSLVGYLTRAEDNAINAKQSKLMGEQYILMQEFGGSTSKSTLNFGDKDMMRTYSDLQNMPSKSYNINNETASKLFERIDHVVNTCDKDLKYQLFGSNCLDFAQDMYARAGLPGDHIEEIYGFHYPPNIFGAYKVLIDTVDAIRPQFHNAQIAMGSVDNAVRQTPDIIPPLMLAGAILAQPAVAVAAGAVKDYAASVYQHFFGSAINKEELDKIKSDLVITKPVIVSLEKLKQEFYRIHHKTYTTNLRVANDNYDEVSHSYTDATGRQAIAKVRLMAEVMNEFTDIYKDVNQLMKANNELTTSSYKSAANNVAAIDKMVTAKIISLSARDLSSLVESEAEKKNIQALQAGMLSQFSNKEIKLPVVNFNNSTKYNAINAKSQELSSVSFRATKKETGI